MTSDELDFPDAIEEILGWRAWRVERGRTGPVLASVVYGGKPWPPREELKAHCRTCKPPPGEHCSCGVYAAASLEQLIELEYGHYDFEAARVNVVGEVNLWGRVIVCEQGYRAQFAYPKRLYIPTECWQLARPLRSSYGVPTKIANTFRLAEEDPWK